MITAIYLCDIIYLIMPTNLNIEPNTHTGTPLLRWSFHEFKPINRSTTWWVMATIIVLAMLIYAIATANFLFALILVMGSILFILETRRQPRQINFEITPGGIIVGKKYWRWSELSNFWIAYQPPEIKRLYIEPKSALEPRLSIPLQSTNPLTVREMLSKYVSENLNREDIPTSEALAKLLKLQ